MNKILKSSWVVLAIWIIVTVLFAVNQPDLKQIINEKGEATISQDLPSQKASALLHKMSPSNGDTLLLVFNEKEGITQDGLLSIQNGIEHLNSLKETLLINSIIDPFTTPEAKDQMISSDGTTVIVSVNLTRGERDRVTIIDQFEDAIKDIAVTHYITGEIAINNDYLEASNKGIEKSTVITIIFILVVLILMFRSVVTPLVSLFAVGIAYFCSMGIIGIFIHQFDFPITSLTQMFIVLVLFGIGTDYNILLFNRFKEELGQGVSINEAIVNTYKTAGKTIFFSGLTVFMAFASLSFVQFSIYRSANAVAIGIFVLLIELLTLTPVLMKLLAKRFFWPSHQVTGHKESKLWGKITATAVAHPAFSLIVVVAIIAPVIFFGNTKISFDSLKDLPADTPSVKGFNIVAEAFGTGKAMPTTVVLESNKGLDNNEALRAIDDLTNKLSALDGIEEVSGPTQPKGEPLPDFYTSSQTESVVAGLGSANDGIIQIQDGLNLMNDNLVAPDFSSVKDLVIGTGELSTGLSSITDGLKQVNSGITQGASGADGIAYGITGLKSGIADIHSGLQTISKNLNGLQKGYSDLGNGYKAFPTSLIQLKQLVTGMSATLDTIAKNHPTDTDVTALKTQMAQLSATLEGITAGLTKANASFDQLTLGLAGLNAGLNAVVANTSANSQLVQGMAQLEAGAKGLS
ncbi:MAG: MMPL family transporter, partial [Vallitaleaceae bacterium]|nr:MMPL family transporter [Vallitaleaceae bacterium]